MKVLTAAQMREMDRLTVERCGISYATLMETAGARVVEAITAQYGTVAGKNCVVFCGRGNNGGDGAVIARLLWMRGARADVFLLGALKDLTGEARASFEAVSRIASQEPVANARLSFMEISDPAALGRRAESRYDLVIDALLGTGVTRPVEGLYETAVRAMATIRDRDHAPVIAVDIPSGLPSDHDAPPGPHVVADLTVTFTAPKIGNVLPPACYAGGRLVIAPIGTPDGLLAESESQLQLIERKQISAWLGLSRRAPDAHKGTAGDVLLLAGSRGKTGAAALAAESVLKSGAGLVTVATAKSAQAMLVTQARVEVMTEALAETDTGAIAVAALDQARVLAQKRTVIAIGPGLGAEAGTRQFAHDFVAGRAVPLVIDADGLNCLAPWPADLTGSDALPIIITPHPGEMARLTGIDNADVVTNRLRIARAFAMRHHIITILKGSRTLIAMPDGEVLINPTGNAGMATAGSGDVLTGLLAGLLAQHPADPQGAAVCAVYLHGLAGDLAADVLGMRSLLAGDLITHLPAAMLQTGGAGEQGHSMPPYQILS
ncbi:MAG: NAD(P)H-hydrate dehydratase [Blastocatellia bacterium]